MVITKRDPITGNWNTRDIPVTNEQMMLWKEGMCIQYAMPNISAGDREFIKTGINDWDSVFRED